MYLSYLRFVFTFLGKILPCPSREIQRAISVSGPASPRVSSIGGVRRPVAGAVVDDVGGAPTDFISLVLQSLTGPVLGGVVAQCARHCGHHQPLSCLYLRVFVLPKYVNDEASIEAERLTRVS